MLEGKPLRDKLKAGSTCLGIFSASTDPYITELLAGSGYDFIVLDSEHSAMGIESILANIMAMKGGDTVPLVRVPQADGAFIKRVLDAGAGGVVVPQIHSAEEARSAVAACFYPPAGTRGFGPIRPSNYERDYREVAASANDHIVCWIQIETRGAADEIDDIVRIPNLSGVLVGPNDLAASLGVIFQKHHPSVLEAIDRISKAAQRAGVPAGMAGLTNKEEAAGWLCEGFQFATLGNTFGVLMRASQEFITGVREAIGMASTSLRSGSS